MKSSFYILSLFLIVLFSFPVQAQDSLKTNDLTKEKVLKMGIDELYNLPFDQLTQLVKIVGVTSVDELLALAASTASRNLESIDEAPGIVTVITEEQIKYGGYRSLAEVFETVTGIFVIQRQEGRFSLCIRGMKDIDEQRDFRTLTLLDGNPIYGIEESFPLDYIKRIEIVRGAGSALYGSSAFAGVINIITKDVDYENQSSHFSVLGGTNATNRYHCMVRKLSENGVGILASTTLYKSDGYVPELNNNSGAATNGTDKRQYLDVFMKGTYKNLMITGGYNRVDRGAYAASKKGTINNVTIETTMSSLAYHTDIFDLGEFKTSLYGEYYKEISSTDQFDNNRMYLYRQRKYGETNFLRVNGDFQFNSRPIFKKHFLTLGVVVNQHRHLKDEEFRYYRDIPDTLKDAKGKNVKDATGKNILLYYTGQKDTLRDSKGNIIYNNGSPIIGVSPYPKQQIRWLGWSKNDSISMPLLLNTYAVYLQEDYQILENLSFTAGARYDVQNLYDNEFTYRGALNYMITPAIYFKGMYGTAFRSPLIRESFVIMENIENSGNPNLKAEHASTLEFQLGWSPSCRLRMSVDGYQTDLTDYISAVNAELYKNSDKKIRTRGLELEVQAILFNRLQVSANYNFLQSRYLSSDYSEGLSNSDLKKIEAVPLIPTQWGNIELTYKFIPVQLEKEKEYRLSVHLGMNYVGERTRPYAYDTKLKKVVDVYHSYIAKYPDVVALNNLREYEIFNASVRSYLGSGFSFLFTIRNILNKKYYSPPFNATMYDTEREGRSIQASIKYQF